MKLWNDLFRTHILERGLNYYEEDCVALLEQTSAGYTAAVEGTDNYEVEIEIRDNQAYDMTCTCPYAADYTDALNNLLDEKINKVQKEAYLTYTSFAEAARNNSFNREQLQKAFNDIEQSDTIASLLKEIDKADLLNTDTDVLGNAYEYLIGQFASETGKKPVNSIHPSCSNILTRIAVSGNNRLLKNRRF